MNKKLYLSLLSLATTTPLFVAVACNRAEKTRKNEEIKEISQPNLKQNKNSSEDITIATEFKLNNLGKMMNSIEIQNRFNKMLQNKNTNAQIIEYINLFLENKLPHTLNSINIETVNNDLIINYSENNTSKSIKLSGFETYNAKSSEEGKKEFGKINIGDISISTRVGNGGEKIGAIEFQELWSNQFDKTNGDGIKMLDWAVENKYLDVDGDYKNSQWIYTLHRNSHHHGDSNFHTYISAEDKLTGRIYRDFDFNGQPGFTLLGWNSIAKLANIHIHKLIYVNQSGNKATTQQIATELNAAQDINQKLNVISKYTNEEFIEFKNGNNENVDYKIEIVSNPEEDLNQLRLKISFKGKAASEYQDENSALIVLNRIHTNIKIGDYTFYTSGYNGKYHASDLLSWLKPGNENGEHFQPLNSFKSAFGFENITNEEQFNTKLELMNSDELDNEQYPYGKDALIVLIEGFDKDYGIINDNHDEQTKEFVQSLTNKYVGNNVVEGKLDQIYNEAAKASNGSLVQKQQALMTLHNKLTEYADKIGKVVINDRINSLEQRIKKYDEQHIAHTVLDALLNQAKQMLNQNTVLSDRLELADRIDSELEYFQFGDTTQMNFENLVMTLKNVLGFNIEFNQSQNSYSYELDQNFVLKDHFYLRNGEKIEDYSTLTLTINVTQANNKIPVSFNLLFKHTNS
ncbi:hypothetical protein EG856_00855 [Mycoplasmopsis phocirhinis]|uniref:Lipoprotein n=1 Tax=Mycoplasmopsis phocirhinis TaxID=142650 RepID=A0A4P6MQY4_9BACT|nr:hypothetical protein [Mycoplasmopsis phocirhinis]QBF34479.1 hypothetical protein EG856_00855 [Mycoplasmopsis phocirhinis]